MRRLLSVGLVLMALLAGAIASGSDASAADRIVRHFVPNSQRFWDNSKNWTTNYGPAYRDTTLAPQNLVPCTGDYALCFHSGPEPLPCKLERGGRFADCTCTVEHGLNFVVITSILNYRVYLDTIEVCGVDGSACAGEPDKAPVCEAIRRGKLIPPAHLISTFDSEVATNLPAAPSDEPAAEPPAIACPKGPYAGCMTAPCRHDRAGTAICSCPVFYGPYHLFGEGAQCDLGGRLVNSAAYYPTLP